MSTAVFLFALGQLAKDTITGYTGVITARIEWLNGCKRYGLQSRDLHEGKVLEPEWFDESQVDLVEAGGEPAAVAGNAGGGPMPDPKRSW